MSQFNDLNNPNPPKKKTPVVMIVLIVLLVLGVLAALCCGLMAYFGSQAMSLGAREILRPIENTAPMQEHIGEIESASMDLMGTAKRAEKTGEDDVVVVNVRGSKGSGVVLLKGAQGQNFQSATLELPDGRSIPLQAGAVEEMHDHDEAEMPAPE